MKGKRSVILALISVPLLILAGLAAACGDDEGEEPGATTPAAGSDLETSIDGITEMISAAEADDLEAAEAAFEAAHDPLHEVIEALAAADPQLSQDLDEAVEDAEKDFEEGEEAEHIVEIGNEILGLLQQAVVP